MIRLIITRHANEMMLARGIDLEHVKRAVKSAVADASLTEATYDGKMITRHEVGADRTLEVIYCKEGFRDQNGYIIVTAYWV